MMGQDQSLVTANRKVSKGEPCEPWVNHGLRGWFTGICKPFHVVRVAVNHVNHESTKRLAGRQYRAMHGVAYNPTLLGAYIGNLGSPWFTWFTDGPWRIAGQMGLDRRSVSLGSFPVGRHRGFRGPQKITLCRKFSNIQPIGKSC
jgi:hypothetical protein